MAAFFSVTARAELPALIAQPLGFYGGTGGMTSDVRGIDWNGRYVAGVTLNVDTGEQSLWGVDTQTGATHQLGLFGDGIHVANSLLYDFNPSVSGLVVGVAFRGGEKIANLAIPFGNSSVSAWASDVNTGITHQIGLYDGAHALPNVAAGATGPAYVSIGLVVTNAGHVVGLSVNNSDNAARVILDPSIGSLASLSPTMGQSVWIADAYTGDTVRFGLTDAEHTMQAIDGVAPGGYQFSTIPEGGVNETGLLAGGSMQFGAVVDEGAGPIVHAGISLWVGNANTGKTYIVGLTDANHTSPNGTRAGEFAGLNDGGLPGLLLTSFVTSEGFVAGNSLNYNSLGDAGNSAWVAGYDADSDTYVTTRLGFFGTDAGGRYQDATGLEISAVTRFTETGLVGGYSAMLDNPLYVDMQSAWVVDAGTLVRTEVGLLDAAHTLDDGYRQTNLVALTNAGLVAGESTAFDRGGSDAWVQKVASSLDVTTMAAERVGLDAVAGSTSRDSYIVGVTESGFVDGETHQDLGSGGHVQDTWVAYKDGVHYTTDQVGLTGGTYEEPDTGSRRSEVESVLENGVTLGHSDRYYTVDEVVTTSPATWIATRQPTDHYVTTRVGLYDSFHTRSDGRQHSSFDGFATSNSGFIGGYSTNYGTGVEEGQSAWVVDASDAITRQVGATDGRHTAASGIRYSGIDGMTESGFAWGYSTRYTDDGLSENGETAWVYAFSDHSLHMIELSTDLVGYAKSFINGVREDGLAYGAFEQFDPTTGASLGYRAFGWTLVDGVFLMGDLIVNDTSAFDWGALLEIYYVNDSGVFIGSTGNGQLFMATPVPEPSTYAALVGAAMLGFVIVRRRRR